MRKTKHSLDGMYMPSPLPALVHFLTVHWNSTQIHVAVNLTVPLFLPSKIRPLPILSSELSRKAGHNFNLLLSLTSSATLGDSSDPLSPPVSHFLSSLWANSPELSYKELQPFSSWFCFSKSPDHACC